MRKSVIALSIAGALFATAAQAQQAPAPAPRARRAPAPMPDQMPFDVPYGALDHGRQGREGGRGDDRRSRRNRRATGSSRSRWSIPMATWSTSSKMDQTQVGVDRHRDRQGAHRGALPPRIGGVRRAHGARRPGFGLTTLDPRSIASLGGYPAGRGRQDHRRDRLQRRDRPAGRRRLQGRRRDHQVGALCPLPASARAGDARQRGEPAARRPSIPPVADQRLLLAPDQDEDRADDAEHQPGRRRQHIGRRELPQRRAGVPLGERLQRFQAGADGCCSSRRPGG